MRALVTGASKGLGREFAWLAAEEGIDLVLTARSAPLLNDLAEELRHRHRIAVRVIPGDLARPGAAQVLWKKAVEDAPIDILVNNAGLGRAGRFADGGAERERRSIALNVAAYTELTRLALDGMGVGGRILNVASAAGFVPGPGMAVYHATKAYALTLDDAIRAELRRQPTGVTLTTLCPGATETAFFADAGIGETRLRRLAPRIAPADVARAGWQGMKAGRARVVPGLFWKLGALAPRLAPRGLAAAVTGWLLMPTGRTRAQRAPADDPAVGDPAVGAAPSGNAGPLPDLPSPHDPRLPHDAQDPMQRRVR